jgi:uncharacterized protein
LSSPPRPRRPSTEETLSFLRKSGCNPKVINHCITVAKTAVEIAESHIRRGVNVDLALVRSGALLHDIGRSATAKVKHGAEGGRILREAGFSEDLARIAERHVGAGIPKEEAEKLGLPTQDYLPETLEEKIVCYADKLVSGNKVTDIDHVIQDFASKLGPDHPSIERIKRLHNEITIRVNG